MDPEIKIKNAEIMIADIRFISENMPQTISGTLA
jgi:hypothetical protein